MNRMLTKSLNLLAVATVAFTIGAIVGLFYGMIELFVSRVCSRLYRWTTPGPT